MDTIEAKGAPPETRGEVHVGLCPEDFDEGDRIYWKNNRGNLHYGTVTVANHFRITVLPDATSWTFTIDLNEPFEKHFKYIGKPLQISQLKANSLISHFDATQGERLYVQVTDYVPGQHLEGYYSGDELSLFSIIQGENISIEHQLALWELED